MLHIKFGFDWPSGFRKKIFEKCFFFFFWLFFIRFYVPFKIYFSSNETGQSVGGRERENPEKIHLAHPQAKLGLSRMWPDRGLHPHEIQR